MKTVISIPTAQNADKLLVSRTRENMERALMEESRQLTSRIQKQRKKLKQKKTVGRNWVTI